VVRISTRLAALPLALSVLLVGGCGTQSSTPSTPIVAATQGATAAATLLPTAAPTPVITGGSIAAVINGHDIPMSKFRTLSVLAAQQPPQPGSTGPTPKVLTTEVMNQLIVDELVREYAAAHGISVSNATVLKQENQQAASLGGHAALIARLKHFGIDETAYRGLIHSASLGQKVELRVAPLRVRTTRQPVADVRHILIMLKPQGKAARTDAQAHALAQQILTKIQHGASFGALARQYSDDPGSAAKGGEYPQVTRGEMVPQFDQASFNDKLHQPRIIKTSFGYHIIEVLGRHTASIPNQTSQNQAQAAQQAAFNLWVTQQKKAATIKRLATIQKS
jgi:parvulin-like peptidyl-prolyl isomerase